MNRKFYALGMSLLLAACVRPTDRGQQYIDGSFTQILNPVDKVMSDKPRDFSLFLDQLKQVETLSPSLAEQHHLLYENIKDWLSVGGDLSNLIHHGVALEQMGGKDGYGNVMFTGYFSPVIKMRRQADDTYRYPVYAMPDCQKTCPDRKKIHQGALDGLGLELGYSASLIDNFIMEVQGSGFVHFVDSNKIEYFAYSGKNGHPYVSIGKILIKRGEVSRERMSLQAIKDWVASNDETKVIELLNQNPSYVFFKPKQTDDVIGTAGIPLQAGASVAADKQYLPMGSVVLAEFPLLDAQGNWNGQHIIKLFMALDTGGAVKENHLDLYHGVGEKAGLKAGHYKHFGRVWKMLPSKEMIATIADNKTITTKDVTVLTSKKQDG